MKCIVRLLKFGSTASDGSQIPESVVREYIESPEAQEDLKNHRMIGSLTHRVRNIAAENYTTEVANSLKKTVGRDDGLLLLDSNCAPTHYIEKLWIENGGLYAQAHIFDESGFDDNTIQAIRRLKSLLKCSNIGISMVVVGLWSGMKNGVDILSRMVKLKGFDWTLSPSFPGSYVTDVLDDEGNSIREKTYSDVELEDKFDGYKVKTFSNLNELGLEINTPKTSKINNQFTILKAKSYSTFEDVEVINEETTPKVEQKEFSQAHIVERTRLGKLSPRIRFRRLILDYRQALKSQGGIEKISPESLKIMKSLFMTDLLGILQEVTPLVIQGKNLAALLGSGSLSAEVRKSTQELQLPLRLAMLENKRQNFVSKARYQKIQDAYQKFTSSIISYVFNTPTSQKLKEEEEDKDGQN